MRTGTLRVLGVAAVLGLAVACGDDGDDGGGGGESGTDADRTEESGDRPTTSPPSTTTALDAVELTGTEVISADQPTALIALPGTSTLLVAERPGTVRAVTVTGAGLDRDYDLADEPVLDITDDVTADGAEQGLLDIEPADDGTTLYVSYTLAPDGDTRVEAYPLAIDAAPGGGVTVDRGGRRGVLAVEQPYANHNGGDVEIGPDGFLYVGLGDGGSGGDPHGHGQDPTTLLGSILRLDPDNPGGPGGTDSYGIPAGNPFAAGGDRAGEGRPEVWLYGVRNPWRFTLDPATGDLWVADVGQREWEEINHLPVAADGTAGRGANLGWAEMEGSHSYDGGENPPGAVLPIFEYDHDEGCSITGGVIYQSDAIAGLGGAYLFSDYCAGDLRAVLLGDDGAVAEHTFDVSPGSVSSFGVDAGGDVYLLTLEGPIVRLDPAGR